MKIRVRLIVLVLLIVAIIFVVVRAYPFSSAKQPVATVSYLCDAGKTITAVLYKGETIPPAHPGEPPIPGGSAAVTLGDGRAMTLAQTISADGIRYANPDESFIFWSKGNGAFVMENNKQTYTGCVLLAKNPGGLPQAYANGSEGFSIRLPGIATSSSPEHPDSYTVDETSAYQEFGPGKDISGIKFTIPASVATGTNLSADSYVSVEEIPKTQDCTASLFLDQPGTFLGQSRALAAQTITDGGTTYSVASSTGAGAGNRYEETVYAIPGTNPCVAVRYFVHYGVIENYPPGMVSEFDKQALLAEFDRIRRTLVVNQ